MILTSAIIGWVGQKEDFCPAMEEPRQYYFLARFCLRVLKISDSQAV